MIPHDHDLAQARPITRDVIAAAEEVFATALRDFISEFCLLDGSVLIGWVRGERHGNIADLVASSAEPFFKTRPSPMPMRPTSASTGAGRCRWCSTWNSRPSP